MRAQVMRTIDVDDELYHYIASNTRHIGESASAILRRLLGVDGVVNDLNHQPTAPRDGHCHGRLAEVLAAPGKQRDRFVEALSVLAHHAPTQFAQLLELRGRSRRYFSHSADELLASGSSSRPCAIPGTSYFVVTNASGAKKARLLDQAMRSCGLTLESRSQLLALARFSASKEN